MSVSSTDAMPTSLGVSDDVVKNISPYLTSFCVRLALSASVILTYSIFDTSIFELSNMDL